MSRRFKNTIVLVVLVFLTPPLFSQQVGFECLTGKVVAEDNAQQLQSAPCDTYTATPCREAINYAPNSTTEVKHIRVILHFFQNWQDPTIPYPPGNFTSSTDHMNVIRSWFDDPDFGINYRLANVCDPLPKVPGFESPHIEDARFQFLFNGIENEDVFFYDDPVLWGSAPYCGNDKDSYPGVVANNTIIQNDPDLLNAVHVFFPAVAASFDGNMNMTCFEVREGGFTRSFGHPNVNVAPPPGITLFGTFYRYIYDSDQGDYGGFAANNIAMNVDNIPNGGNGILAEWFHIMSVDHPTATGSHYLNDFNCDDGQYDRCDDTPSSYNVNIFMGASDNPAPNEFCGLTECQLGRAHFYGELKRPTFIRFASNNFAHPAPWHDCQIFLSDVEIDGGQITTWDYERRLSSNVIVKSGNTLRIECDVFMPEGGKIIVEPNANLVIKGKVTSDCNSWAGIEVWGGSGSQYYVNGSRAQGRLQMRTGSVIENAETAVKLYGPTVNEAGGLLSASGATFRNNGVGIDYAPYQNYWPFSGDPNDPQPRDYLSTLSNCTFLTNNFYQLTNGFDAFVKMSFVNGVKFKGCDFEVRNYYNDDMTNIAGYGYGIRASDSGFSVDAYCNSSTPPCNSFKWGSFKGLGYGIQATNVNATYPFFVSQTDFRGCYYGIYNSGVSNATILHNSFSVGRYFEGNISSPPAHVGVYLAMVLAGLTLQENDFYLPPTVISPVTIPVTVGVYSRELGEFNNEIRRNSYDNLTYGNLAEGVNATGTGNPIDRGLTYFCNDNIDTDTDFAVVNNGLGVGLIRRTQGSVTILPSGPEFEASGNKFAYLMTDFNNGGSLINYYYFANGVRETPLTTSGDFSSAIAQENDCLESYCAPPCMTSGEIESEKAAYYDSRASRDRAQSDYTNAQSTNDVTTMATKAGEMSYYQKKMDEKASMVVLHLLYDTLTFNQDSLDLWIGNLELPNSNLALALQHQSNGNLAKAENILTNTKARDNPTEEESQYSSNANLLMEVLSEKRAYQVPTRYFGALEAMAADSRSYTGNIAKNILRSQGYYFEPIIRLPNTHTSAEQTTNSAGATSAFQLYPNPSDGLLTTYWESRSGSIGQGTLIIWDATGRSVLKKEVKAFERQVHDLSRQSKGFYFYELKVDGQPPKIGKIVIR